MKLCKHGHDVTLKGRVPSNGGCRVCAQQRHKTWRQGPGKEHHTKWARDYKRRTTIGITSEEFDSLHTAQGGLCAICEQPSKLVPDHNHKTGQMRALLCGTCNVGIGMLGDNAARLNRAAIYLDNYETV